MESHTHSVSTIVFSLPDPLSDWPWPRRLNDAYARAKAASSAWVTGYNAFGPKAQEAFDKCDFKQLRMACDLMQLFFVFDEHSDVADEGSVRAMADCIMAALKGIHNPHGCLLGEITRDFWTRLTVVMRNPAYQRRFVYSFQRYTDAVVQQAQDRDSAYIREISDYFPVRRDTIGTFPSWVFIHIGLELPEDVFGHPAVLELERIVTDIIIIGNDLHSYNVEQSRGDDGHNVIGIVRRKNGWSVHEAMDWANDYTRRLMADFLEARSRLPSFGADIDPELAVYIEGLGNWVRASDAWGFESQRYFGNRGCEIQKHRQVVLLPPDVSMI
ncbi:terpenoid synthase [Auricularia subglabra TFB-10046 SS5]|nr:terpenoid synthase [Auricularia subglabra TFB-10046 SS5]